MPMTTNDIRILALLLDIEPKFLSVSDDELLALVYHECCHLYLRGGFKSFYDSLPNDIAIKFMVDRRTLEWMLENKCHFLVTTEPTLAERLERGANADIWTDYADGCHETADLIDDTQAAMLEAAKLLREHGLDK
jgi:hypothetical protein